MSSTRCGLVVFCSVRPVPSNVQSSEVKRERTALAPPTDVMPLRWCCYGQPDLKQKGSPLPGRGWSTDRDRAAAERDSLPLISGSPVFNTAACHSVSTSRVAEQIKSHLRAWTGTIRRCVKLPDSKLNYFRRKYRAGPNHLTFSSFLATDPRWQWRRRKSTY
ncbi:hypothetical protein EYF80_019653 [Liparis tanakae]|uniref:Uncharacterized protein n=1 Tax=Liparis tanakae TaxID=230148 RepID=A0A4Z2HYX8_9TELE|nr:hypothetical protein EYF80_019653 [Liparis tanakae]